MPEAVYGDMDSLTDEARDRLPPGSVHTILEQDSTDFDKALRHIRAPVVLAAGFTGDRVDHELAVYHGLVARSEARCIVIGARDLVLHAPPELVLDLPQGTRLSLFPLAPVSGRDHGLEWPIEDIIFDPARRIGTSNRVARGPLRLAFDAPGMLVIVPRAHLQSVTASVAGASVWSRTAAAGWV